MEEEEEDEKGPNPPMMVPVADMLNHVANHNANLEYTPVSAEGLCQAAAGHGSSLPGSGKAGSELREQLSLFPPCLGVVVGQGWL